MNRLLLSAVHATAVLSAPAAWYYQQMDLERYRLEQLRDDTRRACMVVSYPGDVPLPEGASEFRIRCAPGEVVAYRTSGWFRQQYDDKTGHLYVTVGGGFRGVGALRSERTGWEAKSLDGQWHAAAAYPDSERPPHLVDIPEDRAYTDVVRKDGFYDCGRELLAYVECEAAADPGLFVGESLAELAEEGPSRLEYSPRMKEVSDGRWRSVSALAFRYLRFKGAAGNVRVVPVWRDMRERGGFAAGNDRLRRMRDVGVHTLRLCAQDFLLDGVKRDRLPWGGDLAVSLLADAYVYGDAEIVRRSLSALDAYSDDVNGIVTYSMWTIISHDLYQRHFGDRQFLEDRWWRIKWRIEDLVSRTDSRGFVTKRLDWVFVDWAKPDSQIAPQMIWKGTLDAAARLADRMGDPRAADYRAMSEKVRAGLDEVAWDDARGIYRANYARDGVFGRQANIYAVVFGVADEARAVRIVDALCKDELPAVGTPYVFGWELAVFARAGRPKEFFGGLERVFGAMLDNGATSFWEGYSAEEAGDDRYGFYGRKWGKSLCHAWSAWPAFIFAAEALGVRPASDGWRTYVVNPMPGVGDMRATVPTPLGAIDVSVDEKGVTVKGNGGIGTVLWRGRTTTVPARGEARMAF